MQSARCQFECEAAMSQLSTAVGNAALMIPVVVAVVGGTSLRSSKGGGKGGGGRGLRVSGGFGGRGAETLWIGSSLGRLVQGCAQVDFRHVMDEDEMMSKAHILSVLEYSIYSAYYAVSVLGH